MERKKELNALFVLVGIAGLEPARLSALASKANVSANSTIYPNIKMLSIPYF